MNKIIVLTILSLVLVSFGAIYAQESNSFVGTGFGIEVGGSLGDNFGDDEAWGPSGRANFQLQLAKPLITQFGISYTDLDSGTNALGNDIYTSTPAIADVRFLLNPFPMKSFFPHIYAGIGVGKNLDNSDSDIMAMIPVGLGLQTRISDRLLLTISGGYNLFLSDDLDGVERNDDLAPVTDETNRFTGGEHDGFFEVNLGLTFTQSAKKKRGPKPVEPKIEIIDTSLIDSDGDGINDEDEITIYKTDPNKADTDGDGLSDGDEILKYKTDPLNKDTDGDGLSDGDEVLKYRTNPLKADTDGDGLSDGDEVLKYKTDPLKADTDGDGLSDGAEVMTYFTNPLKIDTDGGGMSDGAEVGIKRNPLDPTDDLFEMIKGKKTVLVGTSFNSNKTAIIPVTKPILDKLRESLVAYPMANIIIICHADSQGTDDHNQKLSERRAKVVKEWLVKNKIDAKRIKVDGKGETLPIATNDTEEGRAQNRRIEFLVE